MSEIEWITFFRSVRLQLVNPSVFVSCYLSSLELCMFISLALRELAGNSGGSASGLGVLHESVCLYHRPSVYEARISSDSVDGIAQ